MVVSQTLVHESEGQTRNLMAKSLIPEHRIVPSRAHSLRAERT